MLAHTEARRQSAKGGRPITIKHRAAGVGAVERPSRVGNQTCLPRTGKPGSEGSNQAFYSPSRSHRFPQYRRMADKTIQPAPTIRALLVVRVGS